MDNRLIPSLSTDSWVSSTLLKADYLFSHFFLSDYSQSYIYYGNVSSLAYILQQNKDNMQRTISVLTDSLTAYFSKYFNNVIVQVTELENKEDPTAAILSIYLKFTDTDNTEHVLGKLLETANLKIKKIIDINNGSEIEL